MAAGYTKRFVAPYCDQLVKKPVSKDELRAELERETERFLERGGEVERVPQGQSGRDENQRSRYPTRRLFLEPPAPRTFVPEVVAAIEERRKALLKRTPRRKRNRLPQPRRKVIYDDFGEPLRKVWVDE